MHVEIYDGWYIRLFDSVNEIMQNVYNGYEYAACVNNIQLQKR